MGSTTVFVGEGSEVPSATRASRDEIYGSIELLAHWLQKHDYRGYDTFDGLNARYVRPLTFENKLLRTVLQQGVRRFPLNLRPLLGIPTSRSTKGMAFLAKGFIRLHEATGDSAWGDKAGAALQWLTENESAGYSGACWGNHFDYQSRSFYLPKNVPTIVWTSLIGHAFIDAYDHFQNASYLQVAVSACEHITRDLDRQVEGDSVCLSYIPGAMKSVHNSNTLGASFLARTYARTGNESHRSLAEKAMRYTANHQREDFSWYYGEPSNLHWVDNFHTAYVLDCFKYYQSATRDEQFKTNMNAGYKYWKSTFFLEDGTPRYYDVKTLPIDIQCSSQAIDTLVLFSDQDPEALQLALSVARWTIRNMQDKTGYFYYRRYSQWLINKTPTLHWGQATMFCALTGLYNRLGNF